MFFKPLLTLFLPLLLALPLPTTACIRRITTISRQESKLQSFLTAPTGKIYTQRFTAGSPRFSDWRLIPGIELPPCAPVTAIASGRNGTTMYLFATDITGKIRSASKEESKGWSEWEHVSGGLAKPGAFVQAVSVGEGLLDLFVVGTDDSVWNAQWEDDEDGGAKHRGYWKKIGDGLDGGVPAGAEIGAVSREEGKVDVFVVGKDTKIYTAHYSDGQWYGFAWLNGGLAAPGAPVSAVSKARDSVDAFVVGTDGNIWTAYFHPGEGWRGWWKLTTSPQLEPWQRIGVVSKGTYEIDYTFVGKDRHIYTGHFNPSNGWLGPWWINSGFAVEGTPVEIVSRVEGVLDLFVIGLDGAAWGAHWQAGHDGWCGWWRTEEKGADCYDDSSRFDL